MNAATDVLNTLNQLSDVDRNWIIERLPKQAKTRLLSISRPQPEAASPAPAPVATTARDPKQLLRHADPAVLASLLQREPAWMTIALLQSHDWPWREALLAALPPGTRAEVQSGDAPAFTVRLTDEVAGIVATHMLHHVPAPPMSKFEALVEKLAAARLRRWGSLDL
jgi:hypothetical protein